VTGASGTTYLNYDYEDRITSINHAGGGTSTYTYNALDTRVGRVDKFGQNYTYKRDGAYVTDPVLNEGFYKFTPGVSVRSNDTSRYYHHGIKNVNALSEQNKTLSATRQYDAFGNVVGSTGAWSGPFGYAGPFGYQEDGDSGLKLLGHRYYDSSTGRFLTRDLSKEGRNWYGYCDNNPLSQADCRGLEGRVIVHGDTKGVPAAGIGDWWTMPSPKRGDKEFGAGVPKQDILEALIEADEFYFYGHGDEDGNLYLKSGDVITREDIRWVLAERKRRGKRGMRKIVLRACFSQGNMDLWGQLLADGGEFWGYSGLTGETWPPHWNNPGRWKKEPGRQVPRRAPAGGKKKKGKPS